MGTIACFIHKVENASKITNSENMQNSKTSKSKYPIHHKTNKIRFAFYHYNEYGSAFISHKGVIFNIHFILMWWGAVLKFMGGFNISIYFCFDLCLIRSGGYFTNDNPLHFYN